MTQRHTSHSVLPSLPPSLLPLSLHSCFLSPIMCSEAFQWHSGQQFNKTMSLVWRSCVGEAKSILTKTKSWDELRGREHEAGWGEQGLLGAGRIFELNQGDGGTILSNDGVQGAIVLESWVGNLLNSRLKS